MILPDEIEPPRPAVMILSEEAKEGDETDSSAEGACQRCWRGGERRDVVSGPDQAPCV